jgi:hypothetical protein
MPKDVQEAVVAYHDHKRSRADLFFRHTIFVPGRGWVCVYDLDDQPRVCFVSVGTDLKVVWDNATR